MAGRRNVSVPYSGNEGYIRNRVTSVTTKEVPSLITPPWLSSSALRKSELPVVRLAWTKDSYLTQEYQGTLGSISQWKYAIMPNPKGGTQGLLGSPEENIARIPSVERNSEQAKTPEQNLVPAS